MTSHVGILQRIALVLVVVLIVVCATSYHVAFGSRSIGAAKYSANIVHVSK